MTIKEYLQYIEIINRSDLKEKEKIALIKFFILEDENELYFGGKK